MSGSSENKRRRRRSRRRFMRRFLAVALVLALIAGGVILIVNKLKSEYEVTYQNYSATTGTLSNALSFSGSVQAVREKTYTAAADTTVRSVNTAEGKAVEKGARLMRLANGQQVEADFAGTVNQVAVKEGDDVASGDTLVQIVDFSHMKVSIRVDEYDISSVAVGDECTITVTANEKQFPSTIASINYVSASSGNVAYYTATAYLDPDRGVYPGMQVTVTIPQEEVNDVVILKLDALSFDEFNRAFVYMLNAAGEPVQVYVETGVSNGNYVEIRSGVASGDTVYAIVEKEEDSGLTGLLSGLFGSRRFTGSGSGSRGSWSGSGSGSRSGGSGSGFSGGMPGGSGGFSGGMPGGSGSRPGGGN